MQYVQILYGINKLDVDNLLCQKHSTTFLCGKEEELSCKYFEDGGGNYCAMSHPDDFC